MNMSKRSVLLRAASLAIMATVSVAFLSTGLLRAADLSPAQPFATLLSQWCSVVLAGCALWAWLVTMAVLVEAARTPSDTAAPLRRPGIPSGFRRLVLGACGLALAAGTTAPALATPGPIHLDPHAAGAVATSGPVPPTARAAGHTPPARHHAGATVGDDIVVRPGDSLWLLAAERLPDDADDTTVTRTWRRLYDANDSLIGSDPDHIEPGQRLARPTSW